MPELHEIQNRVNQLFGSLPASARPTTVTPSTLEAVTEAIETQRPKFFSEFIDEHIEEATD